jgi:hypothetical protein
MSWPAAAVAAVTEAVNYVLSLLRTGRLAPADIWAYHHGDGFNDVVVKSMSNGGYSVVSARGASGPSKLSHWKRFPSCHRQWQCYCGVAGLP